MPKTLVTEKGLEVPLLEHSVVFEADGSRHELLLHTADPRVLMAADDSHRVEELPTWTLLWDCSMLLARQILLGPFLSAASSPITALDLGAGTGLLTMALLRSGIAHVYVVDLDPNALQLVRINLQEAGLWSPARVTLLQLDWCQWDEWPKHVDLLVAGDVLYDPPTTLALSSLLMDSGIVRAGGRFLFADPYRGQLDRFEGHLRASSSLGHLCRHEGSFCSLEGFWSDGVVLEGSVAAAGPDRDLQELVIDPSVFLVRPEEEVVEVEAPPAPAMPSQQWLAEHKRRRDGEDC